MYVGLQNGGVCGSISSTIRGIAIRHVVEVPPTIITDPGFVEYFERISLAPGVHLFSTECACHGLLSLPGLKVPTWGLMQARSLKKVLKKVN